MNPPILFKFKVTTLLLDKKAFFAKFLDLAFWLKTPKLISNDHRGMTL